MWKPGMNCVFSRTEVPASGLAALQGERHGEQTPSTGTQCVVSYNRGGSKDRCVVVSNGQGFYLISPLNQNTRFHTHFKCSMLFHVVWIPSFCILLLRVLQPVSAPDLGTQK